MRGLLAKLWLSDEAAERLLGLLDPRLGHLAENSAALWWTLPPRGQ